jgi:hypothetical protein
MNEPRRTPRNTTALRLAVLAVVIAALWFVLFR